MSLPLWFLIGSLATSALGIGVNAWFQNRTNNRNVGLQKVENEKDRLFNDSQATIAYQRQVEQWNRENEYNTPAAQMDRFVQAGLNPNLIYGSSQGLNSVAGNLSTVPEASSSASNLPNMQNPFGNLDSSLGNDFVDIQLKNAQIDNLNASSRELDSRSKDLLGLTPYKQAEIKRLLVECDNLAYQSKLFVSEINKIDSEAANNWFELSFKQDTRDERVKMFKNDLKISDANANSIERTLEATISNLLSQAALNNSNVQLNSKTIEKFDSEIKLNEKELEVKDALIGYYNSLHDKNAADAAYVRLQHVLEQAYGDDIRASQILENMTFLITNESGGVSRTKAAHFKKAMKNQRRSHKDIAPGQYVYSSN